MKKVCYLSNIEGYMQSWIDFFIERGWKVYNISRHNTKLKVNPQLKEYKLPLNIYIGFPLHLYLIYKIIKKIKPDIVHAQNMQSYGIYATAIRDFPLIIHEGGPDHMKTSKNIQRFIEKMAYKRADLITTEMEENKSILSKEYHIEKNKIKSLLWGVDLSVFNRNYKEEVEKLKKRLEICPEDFVMISNRGLNERSGYKQLLYILKEVKKNYSSIKMVLFKSVCIDVKLQNYYEIKKMIEKMNLTKNVILLDPVPRREIPIYLNIADVAINLLELDNGSSAIAEQMACGCIVIGIDNIGYRGRIINDKNGFLFKDRNNIKEIADVIKLCIKNPEIKEKFYKYNKKYLLIYENWYIKMNKMEKIYIDLINEYK